MAEEGGVVCGQDEIEAREAEAVLLVLGAGEDILGDLGTGCRVEEMEIVSVDMEAEF